MAEEGRKCYDIAKLNDISELNAMVCLVITKNKKNIVNVLEAKVTLDKRLCIIHSFYLHLMTVSECEFVECSK